MTYHKAALLAVKNDHILLCRKRRGTQLLILPGGKYEPGETPEQCLTREITEELGPNIQAENVLFLGTYEEVAAGEPGNRVRIDLYQGQLTGPPPAPQHEIAELVWFGPTNARSQLAPSLRNKILPDLIARGILTWQQSPSFSDPAEIP